MTVNLPAEAIGALRELARRRGIPMTEVLRRAVLLEKYLEDATQRGEKVLLQNGKDTRELIFR